MANIGIENFPNQNLQDWQIQGQEAHTFISNLSPNVTSRMGRGRTARAKGLISSSADEENQRNEDANPQQVGTDNVKIKAESY